MIINRVKLNNFRSYKGEVELNFRPNNERNVVLIGGENGAGKSSIFEAIRLCLYGPATYKYKGIVSSYVVCFSVDFYFYKRQFTYHIYRYFRNSFRSSNLSFHHCFERGLTSDKAV